MNLSRREFIEITAASAVLSVVPRKSWGQGSTPMRRLRLEEFEKSPELVQALKRGVQVMKGRDPSDPTSWFFQAAVHAVSSQAVAGATERDPKVAQVDQAKFWNKCPHFGQSSAEFLLWHRGYVHYFERILRAASGHPTVSLPYWNYTDAAQRGFPRLFGDPELIDPDGDLEPDNIGNPLFDHRRELRFVFGLYDLGPLAVSTERAFGTNEFFGRTESEGFAGGVGDSNSRTKGFIERAPHDVMHGAVGGRGENPDEPGLMSDPETAAFDPVFWVHHTNVDRLWCLWECDAGRSWGNVPAREWREDKPWFFHDADGSVQNPAREFYLDRANFDVAYDSDDPACQPLSKRSPLPSLVVASSEGSSTASLRTAGVLATVQKEAGRSSAGVTVGPDEPARAAVPLSGPAAPGAEGIRSLLSDTSTKKSRRIVLELEGIKVTGVPTVGFDVYVNVPEGQKPSRESDNFVGTLGLFGVGHDHDGDQGGAAGQQFDITEQVEKLAASADNITVTIAPFDLYAPQEAQPRIRRDDNISISGFRILTEEADSLPRR